MACYSLTLPFLDSCRHFPSRLTGWSDIGLSRCKTYRDDLHGTLGLFQGRSESATWWTGRIQEDCCSRVGSVIEPMQAFTLGNFVLLGQMFQSLRTDNVSIPSSFSLQSVKFVLHGHNLNLAQARKQRCSEEWEVLNAE